MSIKDELVLYYNLLRQHGCNDSHSGNASVRDNNVIWITPTGACADTLLADDLIKCNIDGKIGKNASYDSKLHIEIYKNNPKAKAVLHSHSPHTIALTMNGVDFVPKDFEGKLYFPIVPVHTIVYEEYLEKSPGLVAYSLRDHCITVVCGHGVYASAETLNLAYKWTCSLEHSAKIAYLAKHIEN